jgi:LysM repeat protein
MKPILSLLLLLVLPYKMFSQTQAQVTIDYINKYKAIAIKEMKRTGIPASITLAQGIVESGSGESNLAKKANNHFGIKCKTEWTGEKIYQDDDTKNECFRVYPNAESSFIDHSNFIKNRPYYTSLFELDPVDDTAWAFGLKKAGYATEKDYPSKLLNVIELYELAQYNFPELNDEDSVKPPPPVDTLIKLAPKKDTVVKIVVVKDTVIKIIRDTIIKVDSIHNQTAKDTTSKPSIDKEVIVKYPSNLKFKINQVPAIWAVAGRSFLEIASTYNIMLFKLFEYNELPEQDIVQHDQLLFLKEKKKESDKKIHIVKKGEGLYDISQQEGIQLKALQSYNPTVSNDNIKEGTTLYLFNMPKEQTNTTPNKSVKETTPKKSSKFKIF